MHTNLILSIDRRNTPAQALETVALAQHFRGARGVVGIDLCGDPTHTNIVPLAPAFAEAHALGIPITLHFAEAESSGTDAELLMMLREWRPKRIGHVIHLSEAVRREVKAVEGGLGLELCLSCNVHAGMIEGGFESHHFGEWCKSNTFICVV